MWVVHARIGVHTVGDNNHSLRDDDDEVFLFLQKQQPAHRYIPIGYASPGIKESTCDDATIMSLMVP
jgi:hypothetical protein